MTQFISQQLTKGRFTRLSDGDYREFSLNPTEIDDDKGYNYPEQEIPGISDPLLQAGSGTARTIQFKLYLDADSGYRLERRAGQDKPMDLTDEISWYRSFLYTEGNARMGLPGSAPEIILFSFGPFYDGVRCVMTRCPIKVMQWTPWLAPMKAELNIQLKQLVSRSIPRSNIYDPQRNRGF